MSRFKFEVEVMKKKRWLFGMDFSEKTASRYGDGSLLFPLLLIVFLSASLGGCGRFQVDSPETTVVTNPAAEEPLPPEYQIQPGDQLQVNFLYNPEMNEQLPVRPDGRIAMQLIREVYVTGMTAAELKSELEYRYAARLADPTLTVHVQSADSRVIYVDGEVHRPGMFRLIGSTTVLQALANAGGLNEDTAKDSEIIVIRRKGKKPQIMRLALRDALENDFVLKPYDIIHVPKKMINQINQWVVEYFTIYFPLRFTWNYDLTDYGIGATPQSTTTTSGTSSGGGGGNTTTTTTTTTTPMGQ